MRSHFTAFRWSGGAAALAAILAVLAVPAFAQTSDDPFRNAPGPEPPAPPKPRPQTYRKSRPPEASSPETAPTPAPVPVVTAPQAAPAKPAAPSLAGVWSFENNCPLSTHFMLRITALGNEQYSIADPSNAATKGLVAGQIVQIQMVGTIGDTITAEGTVTSPTTMAGKTRVILGYTCDWWAKKQ